MSPSEGERLDVEEAIARLQIALRLQYRAALGYTLGAGSVVGFSYQHLGDALWHFAELELADTRRLVEKIVTLGAEPTTEIAPLCFSASPPELIDLLIETEEEATEALQALHRPDRARGTFGGYRAQDGAHDHAQAGADRPAQARAPRPRSVSGEPSA